MNEGLGAAHPDLVFWRVTRLLVSSCPPVYVRSSDSHYTEFFRQGFPANASHSFMYHLCYAIFVFVLSIPFCYFKV
jgi:hypothetical protein